MTDREELTEVLTAKQLRAWTLYQGGLSYRQVAKAMGIDFSTVKGHIEAAERRIAQHERRSGQ